MPDLKEIELCHGGEFAAASVISIFTYRAMHGFRK